MDELMREAIKQGPFGAILLGSLWLLWRGVGPRIAGWTDALISHWIESGKARDTALAKLLEVFAAHELRDEERHREKMEHTSDVSIQARADIRSAVHEAREYLCERIDIKGRL